MTNAARLIPGGAFACRGEDAGNKRLTKGASGAVHGLRSIQQSRFWENHLAFC
jgi:hypothetical protein